MLGYNALQAGVRALPFAFTMGAVAQPAAKVAARIGTKIVVTAGLATMAVGLAWMATSTAHTGYGTLVIDSIIIALGMGLVMAPATESIMGSLPPAQAGVGSAVNDTIRSLGGALGVAIMGSVAASIFTSHIRPALAHVPASLATQAQTSVGAAVTVGQHAPASVATALVHSARQAFITGSDHAMIVAVFAALLGSLVAWRFLPAPATERVIELEPLAVAPAVDLVAAGIDLA